MLFNTRKAGPPAVVGEPITVTEAQVAEARASVSRGLTELSQRLMAAVKAGLTPDERKRLKKPMVRYQQLVVGEPLEGPTGWHIDFTHKRPQRLFLFISHGPATVFLRDSNLHSPVDPDGRQPLFNAHVAQEVVAGLQTWTAPIGRILCYDNREAHRSEIADRAGWRYFFRVALLD